MSSSNPAILARTRTGGFASQHDYGFALYQMRSCSDGTRVLSGCAPPGQTAWQGWSWRGGGCASRVKIPAASGGALKGTCLLCWGNLSPKPPNKDAIPPHRKQWGILA